MSSRTHYVDVKRDSPSPRRTSWKSGSGSNGPRSGDAPKRVRCRACGKVHLKAWIQAGNRCQCRERRR